MPSGKRRMHSVSGRHNDDRCRNAPGVFRKAFETFFHFRSLPSRHGNCRSACRHRTKFFEVHYTPFTLKCFTISRHVAHSLVPGETPSNSTVCAMLLNIAKYDGNNKINSIHPFRSGTGKYVNLILRSTVPPVLYRHYGPVDTNSKHTIYSIIFKVFITRRLSLFCSKVRYFYY